MFQNLDGRKTIIGLVHLLPMPNTPYYCEGDFDRSLDKALRDTQALLQGGADGCLLQTVDRVYPSTDDTDYVRVACMSVLGYEVRRLAGPNFKIGVQLMWNCVTPSLAAAKACKADFTRCSALIGSTVSPFGPVEANPLKVLNYRNQIGAQSVGLLAELSGYHFHMEGGYQAQTLLDAAFNASMIGVDAVELYHRDETVNRQMTLDLRQAFPKLPIILGGGTNAENCARRLEYADGALVGSCFEDGKWGGQIDSQRVKDYMTQVR